MNNPAGKHWGIKDVVIPTDRKGVEESEQAASGSDPSTSAFALRASADKSLGMTNVRVVPQ